MHRYFVATTFLLLAGLAAWGYLQRAAWQRQLACYRVGAASSFDEAAQEIAWFEAPPDRDAKLRELTAGWATGNEQFDSYLARYLYDARCGEPLREAFSLELGWRPELIPRWAHNWSWRSRNPAEEVVSIRNHLSLLVDAQPARKLTWREVLDVQAVFALTGQEGLARRLSPDEWQARYKTWIAAEAQWTAVAERPANPFP